MHGYVYAIDRRFWRRDLFTSYVVVKGDNGDVVVRASLSDEDETTVDFRSDEWFHRSPEEPVAFLPALPDHCVVQSDLTPDGTFEYHTIPIVGWWVDEELVTRPMIAHHLPFLPDDDDWAVFYPNGTVSKGRDGNAITWNSLDDYLAEREMELRAERQRRAKEIA